jgi:hypothetical protein
MEMVIKRVYGFFFFLTALEVEEYRVLRSKKCHDDMKD